jgi:hypothetical protein
MSNVTNSASTLAGQANIGNGISIIPKGGANPTTITAADWNFRLVVRRNF